MGVVVQPPPPSRTARLSSSSRVRGGLLQPPRGPSPRRGTQLNQSPGKPGRFKVHAFTYGLLGRLGPPWSDLYDTFFRPNNPGNGSSGSHGQSDVLLLYDPPLTPDGEGRLRISPDVVRARRDAGGIDEFFPDDIYVFPYDYDHVCEQLVIPSSHHCYLLDEQEPQFLSAQH